MILDEAAIERLAQPAHCLHSAADRRLVEVKRIYDPDTSSGQRVLPG
jgi:hypothetical protein